MDIHPWGGTLYAMGKRPADGTDVLLTLDPVSGRGTEVGPLVNTASFGGGGHFDLAFRSDGTLFLAAFPESQPCVSLFSLDLFSGAATEVGPTGTCSPGNALGFAPEGTLYLANRQAGGTLFTVEPTTGAATAVRALVYVGFPALTNPRPNALDFDEATGLAYVAINDGVEGAGPNYLALLDPTTGQLTHIGATAAGLDALATSAEAPLLFGGSVRAAASKDTFFWTSPVGFVFVRGPFAMSGEIGEYAFDTNGSATGNGLADATVPAPSAGLWYLFRLQCPTASWSSGGASECPPGSCPPGGRDAVLP
jgi:hypothetical protein